MPNRDAFVLPDAFRIPFDGIDAEHESLVEVVNDFAGSLTEGQTRDFEIPFERFLGFMERHFRNEESQMRSLGYRGLAWHHEHHQDCLERARKLRNICRKKGFADCDVVCDCFDEIIHDIAAADLKFAEFLDGMGLLER